MEELQQGWGRGGGYMPFQHFEQSMWEGGERWGVCGAMLSILLHVAPWDRLSLLSASLACISRLLVIR